MAIQAFVNYLLDKVVLIMLTTSKDKPMRISPAMALCSLFATLLFNVVTPCAQGASPVVFWNSDSLQPGDAVLLYGNGLAGLTQVKVWQLTDDSAVPLASELTAPPSAPVQPIYQPCNASLKFLLPITFQPGIYAAELPGAKPLVLNRPVTWFLQPEQLKPGLSQNQAPPGAKIQLIGKDFLLPGDKGKPQISLQSCSGGSLRMITPDKAERFSLRAALPKDLPPGVYALRVANGFGGAAGWSDPLKIEIKTPDLWPEKVFDVKKFGALGDDITDDTVSIRGALDAAEKNGGGVVYFPWGTYSLTDWIRIPRKTIMRGEERDATILKWPVDEPQTEQEFTPAAVYGDTSYGVENLTLIARKVNAIFMDLSTPNNIAPELKPFVNPEGSRDVFFRNVAFHHWMLCSHPDRNAVLWAKRYTDNQNPYNFRNGAIRNFEVSDCLFQGANQSFFNIRNARILRNSFSNGMGYCWTCLGGGVWYTVAEDNDLRCSSPWGYGKIGMNMIYSARNICHNFVHGEREAMTCDISATPATPYTMTPDGMHVTGNSNIAWFGLPKVVGPTNIMLNGIKAGTDDFAGKTVMIMDGPGAGQYREITRNTPAEFTIDRPWDVLPTVESTLGLWDLCRHMIVSKCEGYDTSAFAQLYGSFYDYIVDGCTVDRSQGTWGQSGWFVQFRYNTIRYANSYHQHIGNPGKNREGNTPFGFNGLTDGNLRITKFGSAQYGTPGGKALFVKDVVPHPVPGVRGCVIKGNELSYNQRITLMPGRDPMSRMGTNDFLHMTDALIDHNTVSHSDVGVFVGGLVSNVLCLGNIFQDVKTNVIANPAAVLSIDPETKTPAN